MDKQKKTISFYSFTSCEGCMMNVLLWLYENYDFLEKNYIVNNFRLLKKSGNKNKEDIAIIEGAISSHTQKKKIKDIRKRAKKIIAIGSCAITGSPSNNRNFIKKDKEIEEYIKKFNQLDKVYSVKDIIKVDKEIPGCPLLIDMFDKIMRSKEEV